MAGYHGDSLLRKERWRRTRMAATTMTEWELAIIRQVNLSLRHHGIRRIATVINQLANGLLYPILALLYVAKMGSTALPPIVVAIGSVGLAHSLYPLVKKTARRIRPFELDSNLDSLTAPLDKYAFPSGHIMTLTATALPFVYHIPETYWIFFLIWLLVAWGRIVVAHHFPSDIIAGTLLGLSTTAIVIQLNSLL